jgi:flagellar biosynthesis/type III secretory pathway protein FliH
MPLDEYEQGWKDGYDEGYEQANDANRGPEMLGIVVSWAVSFAVGAACVGFVWAIS